MNVQLYELDLKFELDFIFKITHFVDNSFYYDIFFNLQ